MRARFVNESSGKGRLSISEVPERIANKFPILRTLNFALMSNALNMNGHNLMKGGKLDFIMVWNYLKRDAKWTKNLKETTEMLTEIAPLVGITKYLSLPREEKAELKSIEKAYRNPNLDYDYFKDAEIPRAEIEETDYVVRNDWGMDTPAFYRFTDEETGEPKRLASSEERNMLRMVYAIEHGSSDKGTYDTYMGAVPAIVGNIKKWGRSLDRTRDVDPDDFIGKND